MRRIFQSAALLLLSGGTVGAERRTIIPTHGHDLWDGASGFPGGYVYSMSQTDDGYIWIGTSKGLVRYGGWTFLPIPEDGASVGAKVPILNVVADSNDELWATDDHTHLFRYAAERLAGPISDNGRHRYLAALLSRTRDGRLLFASELQGVVEYQHGSPRLLLDPGMTPRSLTALTQTADGTFWIGTRETGVFRLTLTPAGPSIQHLAALTSVRVNCLLPIGDSALLIGTDKGLLTLHNGNLTKASPELGRVEILALANGREGDVWIGSDGHVFRAHERDIEREGKIRALDSLSVHGTVTALFEDRDGDLWIGGPDVIERYRASGFTTYLTSAGLPCSNCGAIYTDPRDRIWFAPLDGGLFLLSKGSIRGVETAGLKDDTVYSVAGGAEDEVWVARKNGGVTRLRLDGDALQANMYTRQNGLTEDSVYSIYRAPDGTVWAGTLTAGLSRFHDETWHTFNTNDGLPSNTISAITGNTAGEIFAGTPNGLAVLQHNHWVACTTEQGLPPGAVESLLFDDAGTLWIGTKKGISFLQSGTVHVPLGAPEALYGEILGIAESQGWLWITTRDHVLRVKRTALLNQSFGEGEYREFGVTEGLPSSEGVKRSRTVVADHRGRIWFSLNKGISVLEPSAFARPAFPVTVRVDGMLVDERAVAPDSLVHIPAGRHRLTFRYAGVNVSNPTAVRYRYRLDKVDPAWSEPTALREIDYTNIPPGQFRFHVMGRNPDGVWSGQEKTITFEVDPAYWQTNWFRALSVAAILAMLWTAYRLRMQQARRQEKKLLDVVETIPTVAWSALPDGSVDFVNRHWQEYTGLSIEKTVGSGWQEAVHAEDLEQYTEKWRASITAGEPFENEVRLRRAADGQYLWFLTRAVPLRDGRGKVLKWYGTSTDIEDRKRAEQLQGELAHVNRVTTLGELTASLAHEINQPIGAAVTNAQACMRFLNRDQPDVQQAREAAVEMVKDARRGADIIDRVRSLYRKGFSKMEMVDVNEVIREMVVMLHNQANRYSVMVRTELCEALPQVMADRVQLQQVLMNLMLNGIEAMRDMTGELSIKSQLAEGGQLLISVSDIGVGLPKGKADEIFNAFFTTKPQGTGMGLAITRSIVESHGGRVWATANAGRGSTFHFTLPQKTAAHA